MEEKYLSQKSGVVLVNLSVNPRAIYTRQYSKRPGTSTTTSQAPPSPPPQSDETHTLHSLSDVWDMKPVCYPMLEISQNDYLGAHERPIPNFRNPSRLTIQYLIHADPSIKFEVDSETLYLSLSFF